MSFVQLSGKSWGGTEYHINTKLHQRWCNFAFCAGAQGNIAGRRADKGSAGDSANGTATNSENSTARNSASETAHYRANGAAHRADKGKARAPANGTTRDSERGTADGSGNSRQDATADNAPKGYLVCPTCGNIYPAECSDSYCPCCLTDGRRFVAFEE